MRPNILNSYFASLTSLPGIGPRIETLLGKLLSDGLHEADGKRIIDLLWHFPRDIIDRSHQPDICDVKTGMVTVKVTIGKLSFPPQSSRAPARVTCFDNTGELTLVFFHARRDYLKKIMPQGETVYVSGFAESYGSKVQIVHPDYIVPENQFDQLPLIEPVYPLTKGVSLKTIRKALEGAFKKLPSLPEWQEENWLNKQNWPDFLTSMHQVHEPKENLDLDVHSPQRARLAYDELLANQLSLALVRRHIKSGSGRSFTSDGGLQARLLELLPFSLTSSQSEALEVINQDMASNQKMVRLLQGDVGSGKTVIALLALLKAVEAGTQGVLMAPTEILTRQHLKTIEPLCEKLGLTCAVLTAKEKGKKRVDCLEKLQSGEIDILIGTHALLEEAVQFKDLGLVVIDEQHRFGVHQRLVLQEKGQADLLVMTATPIPRTLTLTYYGDMDVVRLTEKPAGRKPIATRVLPEGKISEIIEGLHRAINAGRQAYWVCPLVEESDLLDATAAIERHRELEKRFPGKVGLVHGRMKPSEKDKVMALFAAGEISILVATTVIEVGIDVANASIMIVEHAERFGLSQLHQLRGRVGRGSAESSCLLVYSGKLGAVAEERLKIMRDTEDGFLIAEEDMRLRGAGEVLGVRQSGNPEFKCADLPAHLPLLEAARDDAKLVLEKDPFLKSERGQNLKTLLYLFDRISAIKLIQAG